MDGNRCCHCGSHHNLAVHHCIHRSLGGKDDDGNLMTLCNKCHRMIHDRRINIVQFLTKLSKRTDFRWAEPLDFWERRDDNDLFNK